LRQRVEARRRAAEAARLAAIEAAKPKPAEFTMEYLGNFGPPEKKIAVFNDGKKIYNALQGDVIDNKFIVARIGYESVDIRFVGFPDWPAKRLGVRRQ
jgi:type IV secretory pathway VirB9-like protein